MSISKAALLALGTAAMLTAYAAAAQPRLEASTQPTVVQAGSAFYRFDRFTVPSHDGQRQYDVQIGIPKHRPPAKGFPVVYMLDGGAAIEGLSEDLLRRLDVGNSPPVLVAIGYVGQPRFDVKARAFDYTPPDRAKPLVVDDQDRPGGGAADFLRLIEARIKPKVERMAPIDRRRQTLWGHSYGGLAVLYAAIAHHPRFQRFAAADPALWWNYGSLLSEARAFAAHPSAQPRVIEIMTGGNETRRPGGSPARSSAMRSSVPSDSAKILADSLAAAGNQVAYNRCEGAGHGDMFRISLIRTLLNVATDANALSCS